MKYTVLSGIVSKNTETGLKDTNVFQTLICTYQDLIHYA